MIFLKDKSKALKVGIGMISRGEVGLSAGALATDIYTSIIIMGGRSSVLELCAHDDARSMCIAATIPTVTAAHIAMIMILVFLLTL